MKGGKSLTKRIEYLEEFASWGLFALIFLYAGIKLPIVPAWAIWFKLGLLALGSFLTGMSIGCFMPIFETVEERYNKKIARTYEKYKLEIVFVAKWGTITIALIVSKNFIGLSWKQFLGMFIFTIVMNYIGKRKKR